MRNRIRTHCTIIIAMAVLTAALPSAAIAGTTKRVSVASDGTQGNNTSGRPSISGDGRLVAFESHATNLVAGDTNGKRDAFVHDRQTGQTSRVSVASDGTQANDQSLSPSISGDGRLVVFYSYASNLVTGDTNSNPDTFVHDRQTGQTSRVSMAFDGTQGNGASSSGSFSGDGRLVAFRSGASNLVAGDTDWTNDVFVHDRQTGQTKRVSVASDGTEGNKQSDAPAITADGRFVAFRSQSTNLVVDDTNGQWDTFVRDRQTGETTRVSVASNGTEANNWSTSPSISADGRFVTFATGAGNLVDGDTNETRDVFVHDRQTGQTTRVSVASDGTEANSYSDSCFISADGRFVAFGSPASNLAPGDTNYQVDTFVHDRLTGRTSRASIGSGGAQGNGVSTAPALSADGRFVAFLSWARSLVFPDTNLTTDVLLRDRGPHADINEDCAVNILDMLEVRNRLQGDPASDENWKADLNGDGAINILDLLFVRNDLGATCE